MGWPEKVKEDVLVDCGRHCSLCHKFCGIKIELHHIKEASNGGQDVYSNCIALCFDCHADMRTYDHKHPKGTKYTEQELIRHRDNWYSKVKNGTAPRNEDYIKVDLEIFKKLLSILPPAGSILNLRNLNFSTKSFSLNEIRDIDEFYHYFRENPHVEFFDPDLESKKSSLLDVITKFISYAAVNTFSMPGQRQQGVPREWEQSQPERYETVVKTLNEMADLITKRFDEFNKLGMVKLSYVVL